MVYRSAATWWSSPQSYFGPSFLCDCCGTQLTYARRRWCYCKYNVNTLGWRWRIQHLARLPLPHLCRDPVRPTAWPPVRQWRDCCSTLTHWGRVTHICVNKLTIIGSDNGLSPGRRQAIIWTNTGILLIRTLGTNFSEILDQMHSFSFKKMHLKMSSEKGRLFSLGLNELNDLLRPEVLVAFRAGRAECRPTYWSQLT